MKFRRKLKPLGTLNDTLSTIHSHCMVSVIVLVKHLMSLLRMFPPARVKSLSISVKILFICLRSWHIVSKSVYCRPSLTTAVQGRFPSAKDYIQHSIAGMEHLHTNHKQNVLAGAARAFGVLRPDGSDSLFPTSRMPFGMLDYMISFFNASSRNEVCG